MLKPPPGTISIEHLNDMTWSAFDRTVGKSLPFTRNNSWIWRNLLHPAVIARTADSLFRLRRALETTRPDDKATLQEKRHLLHCRQEELRTAQELLKSRAEASALRAAIQAHRDACSQQEIIPEGHDRALWASIDQTEPAPAQSAGNV